MSEENNNCGSITTITQAVSTLTEKIPVYQDAIQPAAKELGKGLQVIAKAVNTALLPLEAFIWGVESIRDFVRECVGKKLENISPEEITPPKAHIAVPAIDALRYTGPEDELAELYANLLATSMDRITAYRAHPAFVDIIKNMCPDEARIMRFLASKSAYPLINIKYTLSKDKSYILLHRHLSLIGVDARVEHPPLTSNYLDNLERLGLITVEEGVRITNDELYKPIEQHPQVMKILQELKNKALDDYVAEIEKIRLSVTDLGKQFIRACVIDKAIQPRD